MRSTMEKIKTYKDANLQFMLNFGMFKGDNSFEDFFSKKIIKYANHINDNYLHNYEPSESALNKSISVFMLCIFLEKISGSSIKLIRLDTKLSEGRIKYHLKLCLMFVNDSKELIKKISNDFPCYPKESEKISKYFK